MRNHLHTGMPVVNTLVFRYTGYENAGGYMPKIPVTGGTVPTMERLDLHRPVVDQIYSALKSAILSRELFPGQAVSENEIGQSFSSSRTPVREALSRLRDDGLIVTLPSRGTYVSRLSEKNIRSAQFIREALEVAAVSRLCQIGLTAEAELEIEHALNGQRAAMRRGDRKAFRVHDDQFHSALAAATGLERLETLLIREKAGLDRLRALAITDEAHMARLLSEHEAVYDAIKAGDEARAADDLRKHLRRVLGILSQVFENHQDYFE
ncbi:putative HTH-type transcriptional regulator YdfH [compost metagenome]|jgi:DNA-binding GntR family transcriptional regulator|uniref:GntR family transcriptional regulator n=4 Tax=Agrobacterium tumefaciens complex TaxID=1183400 RepID=A0A822V7J8_AGRTU|nr:GntR family transcriptional regulator [Agrobacterium tumefaciens]EHH04911.1 GntR family transcriptional regulator [Agrobacterium tumefaciens CCNWGS0286]CUX54485.1 GntR family transcriptional regulator [Agrobacterium tumefaciens str. Kerr 14]CVI21885.1 GntR family transcriptional regulator [Agrobacterium tumefaciens str. B6]AYM83202.1 GntR family transcriptional regulator [Agrobacterium tumefaciens]